MRTIIRSLVALAMLASGGTGFAQDHWPSRPLRLILPFPPGGGTDILGRQIAEKLSERLGQPVVAENRGGAGGNVGAEAAAHSAPDGYTLVLVAPSLAISPTLYSKLNYDPVKDLQPITLVATIPNVLLTQPGFAPDLKAFIAKVKQKPGQYNFGSGGPGTSNHLGGELFNIVAGTKLVHVPYKGVNLAMQDVMAGRIEMVVIGLPAALPQIRNGRVKALAVIAPQRQASLPDVPTAAEAGLPNFDVTTWYGVLTVAGTPRPIVDRLNRELVAAMTSADMKQKLAAQGTDVRTSTPDEFAAYIKEEIAKWGDVIHKAGLHAN
jgi:tripartite-type tricarboxylate transporter receptor subunit TctC